MANRESCIEARLEKLRKYSNFTDDNTRTFHVFEMRIGMNEFDHRIFSVE